MDWLPLALLCAFALAAADTATKRFLAGDTAAEQVLVRLAFPGLLLAPLLFWRPPEWPPLAFWAWVGVALPLEIAAMVLYVKALRASPLYLTVPYLAFTPVFTSLIGYLLLGETISGQGLAGIVLIVLGAYALNLEGGRLGRPGVWLAPLVAFRREAGSRYMLGVALIYGLTSVLGKGALQYMPAASLGPFYFILVAAFSLLVFAVREPGCLRVLARPRAGHWLVAGLMAVMVFTHFLALERVETAYMIAVKRTSILFAIVFGALVFREAKLARHFAAGAVMVAGVALISL